MITPPTPQQQAGALARLARTPLPEDTRPTSLVLVRLTVAAQSAGATWRQVADAIGVPPGQAKARRAAARRWVQQHARHANARLLAQDALVATAGSGSDGIMG